VTTLPRQEDLIAETGEILTRLGVSLPATGTFAARSPITGGELARIPEHTPEQVRDTIAAAADAFATWRTVPAPVRGQFGRKASHKSRIRRSPRPRRRNKTYVEHHGTANSGGNEEG
jgi:hypothetical protein